MSSNNTVRITKLESDIAQMGQGLQHLVSMMERVVGQTPAQPTLAQAVAVHGVGQHPMMAAQAPVAQPKPAPVAQAVRRPAPPLPTRPVAQTAPQAGPAWAQPQWSAPRGNVTPSEAHADHDTCFLGCRAARGQESKPSLGLIDVATGEYYPTGEGKMGALTAHAANGTQWPAVMVETGQQCMVSAAAIGEELARLRTTDQKGNRGVPSILTGESAISGARLTPAPFKRATMAEKLALDERAYRAASTTLAQAQAIRAKMGRPV